MDAELDLLVDCNLLLQLAELLLSLDAPDLYLLFIFVLSVLKFRFLNFELSLRLNFLLLQFLQIQLLLRMNLISHFQLVNDLRRQIMNVDLGLANEANQAMVHLIFHHGERQRL